MSALSDILDRRTRLVAEAEEQRRALGEEIAACRAVFVVADRSIALAAWLRARPYVVVALVTAIAVLRPRFALVWSGRLIALWRAGQLLHHALRLVADRLPDKRAYEANLQDAPGPSRQAP
jgi:Flp pilus assembly protein TadB